MGGPLLEFENVSKVYPIKDHQGNAAELVAIRHVQQQVVEGRFVSIVGPSGCGKSSLLDMVAGLKAPSSGRVLLRGKVIVRPDPAVAMVFQEESTFPWRTVLSNVEVGLEVRGVPRAERRERAGRILDLVGLRGFEHAYPKERSGGMRQRVAIARALVYDPEVLLMDEPFGALDGQTRLFLGQELRRIWEETGKTVLFVTHDIQEAALLSQEIWVMSYRPSVIKAVVEVDLPAHRDASVVSSDRFHAITQQLWEAIKEESERAFRAHDEKVMGR